MCMWCGTCVIPCTRCDVPCVCGTASGGKHILRGWQHAQLPGGVVCPPDDAGTVVRELHVQCHLHNPHLRQLRERLKARYGVPQLSKLDSVVDWLYVREVISKTV